MHRLMTDLSTLAQHLFDHPGIDIVELAYSYMKSAREDYGKSVIETGA